MWPKNPHALLGVKQGSTKNEIKRAYLNLAKKWHPDKNTSKNAEEVFKKIKAAYDTLTDEYATAAFSQWECKPESNYRSKSKNDDGSSKKSDARFEFTRKGADSGKGDDKGPKDFKDFKHRSSSRHSRYGKSTFSLFDDDKFRKTSKTKSRSEKADHIKTESRSSYTKKSPGSNERFHAYVDSNNTRHKVTRTRNSVHIKISTKPGENIKVTSKNGVKINFSADGKPNVNSSKNNPEDDNNDEPVYSHAFTSFVDDVFQNTSIADEMSECDLSGVRKNSVWTNDGDFVTIKFDNGNKNDVYIGGRSNVQNFFKTDDGDVYYSPDLPDLSFGSFANKVDSISDNSETNHGFCKYCHDFASSDMNHSHTPSNFSERLWKYHKNGTEGCLYEDGTSVDKDPSVDRKFFYSAYDSPISFENRSSNNDKTNRKPLFQRVIVTCSQCKNSYTKRDMFVHGYYCRDKLLAGPNFEKEGELSKGIWATPISLQRYSIKKDQNFGFAHGGHYSPSDPVPTVTSGVNFSEIPLFNKTTHRKTADFDPLGKYTIFNKEPFKQERTHDMSDYVSRCQSYAQTKCVFNTLRSVNDILERTSTKKNKNKTVIN